MNRIRTNTIALGLSLCGTAILYFLQLKILTNFLAQSEFGAWVTVSAVGAILGSFSEVGLSLVLTRYGAKYHAEGRTGTIGPLLRATLPVFLVGVVIVTTILFVAGPHVGHLAGDVEGSRNLLLLGYVACISATLPALNNACFRGLRRMAIVAILNAAFAAIVTAGYFLLRTQLSAALALIIYSCSGLLVAAAGWLALRYVLKGLRAGDTQQASARSILSEVRGFWQGAAATAMLFTLSEQIDKPVLVGLATFEVVAVFHVASRLMLFARRLLGVPFQVMSPEVTHKWESGRSGELVADMRLFTKLALGFGLAIVLFLTVFAQPLLLLLSTPEFLSGVTAVWGFAAAIPLLCLQQPLMMFLRAIGRIWYPFAGDALALAVYLIAGSLLLHAFGLPGFVAGQAVASLLALGYSLLVFDHLELPRPSIRFFLGHLLVAASVWTMGVLAGWVLPPYELWQVPLLTVVIALLANFFAVRCGFLDRGEEERAIDLLTGRGVAARAARLFFAWPRWVWS